MRYCYKSLDGKAWWSLKTPDFENDSSKIEITEQEFNAHVAELERQSAE